MRFRRADLRHTYGNICVTVQNLKFNGWRIFRYGICLRKRLIRTGGEKVIDPVAILLKKAEAMGERLDNSNIGRIGNHLVLYSDPSTRNMLHMSGWRECLPVFYHISRWPYAHSPAPFIEKHREGTLAKLSTLSMRDKMASCRRDVSVEHRWALSSISLISDIGLSLISESPISNWESEVRHFFFLYIFRGFVCIVYLCRPSEASTQYCAIPGGYPPQDWQSLLCAREELNSNPGLLLLQSGALPLSHLSSEVRHYIDIGIKFYPITNIRHPLKIKRGVIAEWYSARLQF